MTPLPINAEEQRAAEHEAQILARKLGFALEILGLPSWSFVVLAYSYEGGGSTWVHNFAFVDARELAHELEKQAGILESKEPGAVEIGFTDRGSFTPEKAQELQHAFQRIARRFETVLPAGWGHALWVADTETPSRFYLATGQREDVIKALREIATAHREDPSKVKAPGELVE